MQEKIPSSAHKKRSLSAKSKQNTSSTSLSEITPLQLDKKTDEKQKESENKSKHIIHAENNELQNQIVNIPNSVNSELKSTSIVKDNKIDEDTNKLQKMQITDNEISVQNIKKSDQSISEIQRIQSENKDARY